MMNIKKREKPVGVRNGRLSKKITRRYIIFAVLNFVTLVVSTVMLFSIRYATTDTFSLGGFSTPHEILFLVTLALIGVIAVATVLLTLLFSRNAAKSIERPILALAVSLDELSEGKTNINIDGHNADDATGMLASSLHKVCNIINELSSDIKYVSEQHNIGNMTVLINTEKYSGEYLCITENVNNFFIANSDYFDRTCEVLESISRGRLDMSLPELPGKYNTIPKLFESILSTVKMLLADIKKLDDGILENGILSSLDAEQYQGDFASLINYTNRAMSSLSLAITESVNVMESLAQGDLDEQVKSDYSGFLNKLKYSINTTIEQWKKYINEINDVMVDIRHSDLTADVSIDFKGDFKQISDSLTEIVRTQRKSVEQIVNMGTELSTTGAILKEGTETLSNSTRGTSEQTSNVKTAADEITESITQTSSVLSSTSENITKIASTVEEMSGMIRSLASSSEQTSASVEMVSKLISNITGNISGVSDSADEVSISVSNVVESIQKISGSLNNISVGCENSRIVTSDAEVMAKDTRVIIEKLNDSSKKISRVIGLINEIAAQTNILALNAAIEAASAGDVGKGFAVVATEVKELASQTGDATDDIRALIEEMQDNMSQAVDAVNTINEVISKITEITNEISTDVVEQSKTADEITISAVSAANKVGVISNDLREVAENAKIVSRNVNESSKGVIEIALGAVDLQHASEEAAMNSERASNSLTNISESFKHITGRTIELNNSIIEIDNASGKVTTIAEETNEAVIKINNLVEEFNESISRYKLN
jgi:methyl-accepting chemotaxis protein